MRPTCSQIEYDVAAAVADTETEAPLIDRILRAYDLPRSCITRLRRGGLNIAKHPEDGELLWKSKLFYREVLPGRLLSDLEDCRRDPAIVKNKPRFIIVSDGESWAAADTKTGETAHFLIAELPRLYDFFLPWAGYEKAQSVLDNPADIKAAQKMGLIYDALKSDNQELSGHALNVFLARLLFCFFAEDSGVFPKHNLFTGYLKSHTSEDGSDMAEILQGIFAVMDAKEGSPARTEAAAELAAFPYVNGKLFSGDSPVPRFTASSRDALLKAGALDWADINTDIFGNMFQACVDVETRANLGEHYTSVPNIMKVLGPLFLDELKEKAEKTKGDPRQVNEFIARLSRIRCFDPACGSGNFLLTAYKELRRLEMDVLESVGFLQMPSVNINQFYGIEIDDFAHEIAMLSLWLVDHQLNQEFEERFGTRVPTLPLKPIDSIRLGNALRLDWDEVCPKAEACAPLWTMQPLLANAAPESEPLEIYVFGNPPYLGSKLQTTEQKADVRAAYDQAKDVGNLDYVCAWLVLGAKYIANSSAKCGFVTTNSITQGEQVAPAWEPVVGRGLEIDFAHTSFKWSNNAKYNAGVTCVVFGLRAAASKPCHLYSASTVREVAHISPYLTAGHPVLIRRRGEPIAPCFPPMVFGSMPRDGGHLNMTVEEARVLMEAYPESKPLVKHYIGSQEFIRNQNRCCLWITQERSGLAYGIPPIAQRLEAVKNYRMGRQAPSTRAYAERPYMFVQRSYKPTEAILVPRVSSERREYIPVGYVDEDTVISDSALAVYAAAPWVFGILSSRMHMAWVKAVGGRMKTDYRYSADLCYNTFPLRNLTEAEQNRVTEAAYGVLDARDKHLGASPADLYDPDKMPDNLRAAHDQLDAIVDRLYRPSGFANDEERLECLFALYRDMTTGPLLLPVADGKKPRKPRRKKSST